VCFPKGDAADLFKVFYVNPVTLVFVRCLVDETLLTMEQVMKSDGGNNGVLGKTELRLRISA
jgi:hypothetical protein